MKKAVKIIAGIALVPIILFILLTALFYFPPFQNWAVKQVASYASEMTGMEITVDHVNLAFPLRLAVDGVSVLKINEQQTDTVAQIGHTLVDIQLLPLLTADVEVDELLMEQMKFNTSDFVAQALVRGTAGKLSLKSHGIDLSKENVNLDDVFLGGAKLDVQLLDTIVPEDTTQTEMFWKINLQKLEIANTDLALHMPGDTLSIGAHVGKAVAKNGFFDLGRSEYRVGSADISASSINYDNNFEPSIAGLDYNHLAMKDVSIGLDSILYCDPNMYVKIRSGAMKEKSGLQLTQLNGIVKMDSTSLFIPGLTAETTNSHLKLAMSMDMNTFDEINPGTMSVQANAQLGKGDVMLFMQDMPKAFQTGWPHYPLSVETIMHGNMNRMNIDKFNAELPTAFKASANGYAANIMDTDRLLANVNLDATTYNLGFVTSAYLDRDMQKMIRVPSGIHVKGNVQADGPTYLADLKASQGGGVMALKGRCNVNTMKYNGVLTANAFPIHHFVPNYGLSAFTGKANIDGYGTDVFSKKTKLTANADIADFWYTDFDLSGTTATAVISDGEVNARLNCVNELLRGNISLDALMNTKDIKATLSCSLDHADFYGMKLTESPLSTSLCAHVDLASDLEDYYKVEGFVSDVVIQDSASVFRTEELSMNLLTRVDSTWAKVYSGDLYLDFVASGGYKVLMNVADSLSQELTRQIDRKYIDQDSLKMVLPISHLTLRSGKDNFVSAYARQMDYAYRQINANITTSPQTGINGFAEIDSLIVSGMQLDKTRLDFITDETGFRYKGQVKNEKDNPDYCFNALFDGSLFETGSDMNVALYDADDKLGMKLGLKALLEQNGIRVRLTDTNAILGYRKFVANDDNYLFLADDNRVSAYMKLKAEDGTGIQIYSDDDNTDALQDITFGINHLDLASIVSILPYLPRVEGILDGDFHMIQTEEELSVSSSLGVDGLVYEGWNMGDLASEFVYIPQEDGGHYVDGILSHNGLDVGTIKGTYKADGDDGILDANVSLKKLPLDLVNGFIPDQIMGLRGYGDGRVKILGPMSNLDVSGVVDLADAYLVSVPYGVELKFDDRPVKIENSRLMLQNFNMYSHNSQPLVINGYVDFSNMENMNLNLQMYARNFLVIDSKEKRKSETYGKTYVNLDATATGRVDAIRMKGRLDVLGNTNMTYILRDSPLSNDNRLEELVTFVDFSDKEEEVIVRPAIEGLYVDLAIGIDQGAHIMCALNAEKSNYVDIIGGGNLRLIYTEDDMRLTGRYTLKSGEMKYSLPVIPLKTFNIQDGSYVEFTGDVMNPTLNITATEATKASVNTDGADRNVAFNCGVKITQTLNNMGLEFIIEAPEDMNINNNLQAMSVEERGKVAVTMLTTGMYLTDSNAPSLSMNSALSSFLQSEINSITGNALRTLDLSIGIDNSTDAAGALHTDYSFKFAKRFWDNRIRIVVGGKVSTDNAEAENLFDNVSFEYRLDRSANTNLELFYKRAVYDYLEGYLEQYGVGIVWKRKMQSFSDFLKSSKNKLMSLPMFQTSTKNDTIVVEPDTVTTMKGGTE